MSIGCSGWTQYVWAGSGWARGSSARWDCRCGRGNEAFKYPEVEEVLRMERGQICGLLLWLLPVLCSILTDLEDKSTHSPTAWRISPNILPRKGVGELKAQEPIICAHRRSGMQPAGRSDALKASTPTHAAGDAWGCMLRGASNCTDSASEGQIPTEPDCDKRPGRGQ